MDEDEPGLISGDVETIVIKPESTELLFNEEEPISFEEESEDSDLDLISSNYDECCFVTSSGEVVTINIENIVQTPFYLENYFMDNDSSPCIPEQPPIVIKIDRVTCYACDIVFCNEHRLLEHLMTHIDVYRMGCDICDKDLNLEEKFQLHMMAVTWQSIYYCDFCRKSCAGVVRSKSQPPPPGKTYMCHDCEYRMKLTSTNFPNPVKLFINTNIKPPPIPMEPPQPILTPPASQPVILSIPIPPPPPPAVVLQEQKQKLKHEESENSSREEQDCRVVQKSPTKKKENKKCRRSKPKLQLVRESKKETLRKSTRSNKNKVTRNHKCRYCPLLFPEYLDLMTHLREKHKYHKLKYVCKLCDKEFLQLRCYEDHLSFHQLSKNHMCYVCNLAFLSKYELEQHTQVHDKSKIINTYCNNDGSIALDLRKKKSKSSAR